MPTDSREEQPGSPVERRETGTRLQATRTFICDWADRYYIRGLLCDHAGELYPYAEAFQARCYTASIKPFEKAIDVDAGGLAVYEKAIIVAEYGSPEAGDIQSTPSDPTEIFSEMLEPTVEFMTVDYRLCKWDTPYWIPDVIDPVTGQVVSHKPWYALTADQAPGFQVHGEIYTFTRYNLSVVPTALRQLVGTINQQPVSTRTFGVTYPTETCLLLPCPIEVSWHSIGGVVAKKISLSFKMHHRNIPSWNKFWRPDLYDGSDVDTAWKSIYIWNGSQNVILEMYPKKDWSALWT